MSPQATPEAPYVAAFEAAEHDGAAHDPAWLRELRRDAMAEFTRAGFPTARRGNEAWKYTDVRPLASTAFAAPAPDDGPGELDLSPYELPCPRVHQLVFVDGRYAPQLSTDPPSEGARSSHVFFEHGDGPIVGRLAEAAHYDVPLVHEHLGKHAGAAASAFASLNTAFVRDGAFVSIPDGVSVPEPIYLLFISTGRPEPAAPTVTYPRVLIVAGRDSSATVLLSFESLGDGVYFTDAVTEVVAGPGAKLRCITLQRESTAAYHISTTQVVQARDSAVSSVTIDLGGSLVRHDLSVLLAEPGASVSLNGLYLGTGNRHVDNHTFVDHAVAGASSDEVYKGILDESSRGVFVGHVLVRPGAQHTVAHQVNKNLLLSDEAEADTQPKLEIFADDVTCTHGAAVGALDPAALFYLKSRGIGEAAARALLVHGFVREIVDSIANDAVRQYADDAVTAALGTG